MSFDAHILSLRTLFAADRADGFTARVELRLDGGPVYRALVDDGELVLEQGGADVPDVIITGDPGELLGVAHGRLRARRHRSPDRWRPRAGRTLPDPVPVARAGPRLSLPARLPRQEPGQVRRRTQGPDRAPGTCSHVDVQPWPRQPEVARPVTSAARRASHAGGSGRQIPDGVGQA